MAGLSGMGCQVLEPVLAPGSTVLNVLADSPYVVAGTATRVRVQAQNTDGTTIKDGTEILMSASAGSFDPQKVRVQNGEAVTNYTAGQGVGRVQIGASSGDARGEATIAVGSAPVGAVRLSADRTSLPSNGGDVNVTAHVYSPIGLPVDGAPVEFQLTGGGTISPVGPWYSDNTGTVRVKISTTKSANLRGLSAGASTDLGITLRQPVTLNLTSSKSTSTKGESVAFTAQMTQGGAPATGQLVMDFGDGQSADLGTVTGKATAAHSFQIAGGFNVVARFFEAEGAETKATVRQTVQDSPIAPPPPSGGGSGADQIDPSLITWVGNENISNWAVTSTITNWSYSNGTVCIYHTKQGTWPLVSIDDQPPNIEAQIGFVAKINGKWYGGAYDWMGLGRTCKFEPPENWGRDQIREFPLDASYPGPRSGDEIGLYMSTPASFRIPVRSVNERTNIILVRWP